MSAGGLGGTVQARVSRGSRRLWLGIGTLLMGALALTALVGGQVPAVSTQATTVAGQVSAGPNIVEVMLDDMRADDLQFMPFTRNLMRTQGLEFRNSFSNFPLCCPARASFYSGEYAHNHGVLFHDGRYGYGAFDDRYTIATSLQEVGYQTGMIGKYLNLFGTANSLVGSREAGHPVPSYSYVPHGWDDFRAGLGYNEVTKSANITDFFNTGYDINGTPTVFEGEYNTDTMTDFAVDMTRDFHAKDQPFFVSLNYTAPHFADPEPGDPRHVRRLDGSYYNFQTTQRPEWVRGRFDRRITHGQGMPRDGSQPELDVSDKPVYFRNYANFSVEEMRAETEVTRQRAESLFVVDTQLRRLVLELQAQNEWDNTVFIVTSDNGYLLGEHRVRQAKIRAHEPSLRVPFLVTGPGMRHGARRYDPITTVDVTRTILALAGARSPHPADGHSRVATLLDGDRGWLTPVVTEGFHTGAGAFDTGLSSIGVRTPRYSFIDYARGIDELYDLKVDPYENDNKIKDPTYAEVAKRLKALSWKLHTCAGAECRIALPKLFAATPSHTKALTDGYWSAIRQRYGYGAS